MQKCLFAALVFVFSFSSIALAVNCQFVFNPQTGQYIWTCSEVPDPAQCGWVLDSATGQYVWVCS